MVYGRDRYLYQDYHLRISGQCSRDGIINRICKSSYSVPGKQEWFALGYLLS
jgi:hypothetical protein